MPETNTVHAVVGGIEVDINRDALRDWRVFEAFSELSKNAASAFGSLPMLAEKVFGADQWERILCAVEERDGIADIDVVSVMILEAIVAAAGGRGEGDLKN